MRPLGRLKPYDPTRLRLVLGLLGVSFVVILGRLFVVQIIQHSDLQARALQQYLRHVTLRPERGRILDRHGRVLATSVAVPSVYLIPRDIEAPDQATARLAAVLQQPYDTVHRQLTSKAPFVWLARQVTPERLANLQALKLRGVYFVNETRRYYPKRHLAGQVLGFVGIDEQGLGGLEHLYDRDLSGQPRRVTLQRDAVGRQVRLLAGETIEHPRGADLYLTLDERLQHVAEREIASQVQQTGAKNGLVVIMQPQTGDILTIASYPFFDPNNYRDPQQHDWQRNRTVTDAFEPGSTFKLVVAAASLEEHTVRPSDTFFCENGLLVRGGRRLRDHEPYGILNVAQVIEKSSNICTVKISERLTAAMLYQYIRRFGFGEKSLVDLPGETPGQLRPPQQWSRFSHASLAIGQEIAVTPLQLIAAFAAVANGGQLMRPHIVKRVVDAETVRTFDPEVRWRVLSSQTAETLTAIFTGVVERGTGKPAAVEGYTVAGKTGTAQKADPERGIYSHRKILASFVGYVPAEAPQLVILVMLDEPQKLRWGSQAAAPVFHRIAQQALHYLQIPPQHARPLTVGFPAAQTFERPAGRS
jgi:cell division protein FtsI (penicillin-binding protein 3)